MTSNARMRTALLLALSFMGGVSGCSGCGKTTTADSVDASGVAPSAVPSVTASPAGAPLPLSLPFAAAVGPSGGIYVAGLVVARGVVGVSRYDQSGNVVWSVDALSDVAWAPDAEVHVLANANGVGVIWRGMRSKALVRQMVLLDEHGKPLGEPIAVGAGACVTDQGAVWPVAKDDGSSRVVRQALTGGGVTELGAVGKDKDPLLECGTERVYALEEGEEDVGLSVFSKDGNKPSAPLIVGTSDDDEEREHEAFTVGDAFGVVRATARGRLLLREARPSIGPWRSFRDSLEKDDDIVAVDGDDDYAYVVTTREASERCDASAAFDVRLVRAKRAGAKPEASDDATLLSSEPCGTDVGPFFLGAIGSRFVVAWAELVPRENGKPPIASLAYRFVADADVKRVSQAADAIELAGCDDKRCYFAALGRVDGDAMAPGAAKIFTIP